MNLVVATVGLLAGILVWWMVARRLTARPWEGQGTFAGRDAAHLRAEPPSARVGLWVLLGVITSFFVLLMTAYLIRMSPHLVQDVDLRDWRPVAEPRILWVNTLLLAAGSLGMALAQAALRSGRFERATQGLLAGGAFAVAFLVGQWLAWRELQAAGLYAAANPANAFFYVLTGLHALHLLGGLFVWARALLRVSRGRASLEATRSTVALCTVYWHYLLVVWIVLFGLLVIT
jgi:cytochrome c oxidase subunit III